MRTLVSLLSLGLFLAIAPANAAEEANISWLFVVTGEVRSASETELTIAADPTVIAFSNRPQRLVRTTRLATLVDEIWDAGKDNFLDDPPNAAIVTGGDEVAIEELASVAWSGQTVTFLTEEALAGPPPEAGERVARVIDCLAPCDFKDGCGC